MYVYKLISSSVWAAHGGPEDAVTTTQATPTRAGRFIIGSIAPHVSGGRWRFSVVPWGAPIQLNAKGEVEVKTGGKWTPLHTLPNWRDQFLTNPAGARRRLETAYGDLMGALKSKYGLAKTDAMPAPWSGTLPSTWVFNDFGRVAVKYFIDYNGNRKLDAIAKRGGKPEELLSDFIHTTPFTEMETTLDKRLESKTPMKLEESHGCVHLAPTVLQDWVNKKILYVGASIEIHPYTESVLPVSFERKYGLVGKEIHFFPKLMTIALYQVSKKQLTHRLSPLHHG